MAVVMGSLYPDGILHGRYIQQPVRSELHTISFGGMVVFRDVVAYDDSGSVDMRETNEFGLNQKNSSSVL